MTPATVRCYVSGRRGTLVDLAAGRPIPAGTRANAVTAALLSALGTPSAARDDEAAEYAAARLAADTSVRLLDPDDPRDRRRVVVAVDVVVADADTAAPGEVRTAEPVTATAVVAVHVDTDDALPRVDEAVRAVATSDPRRIADALDALGDDELAWYAPWELTQLL